MKCFNKDCTYHDTSMTDYCSKGEPPNVAGCPTSELAATAEDFIYLIDMGDEIVWCDSPAPEPGMEAKDAVKYVRAGCLADFLKDYI